MNLLLKTKTGMLFCFKLLTLFLLCQLSYTYVRWAARDEVTPQKKFRRALRARPTMPALAVRSRSAPADEVAMMTNDSSSDTSDFSTVPQDFIYVGLRNCEQNTRCLYIGTRFSIGGLLSTVCYSTVFHRFFSQTWYSCSTIPLE